MDVFLGGLAGGLGALGFFGGIALLVWVDNRVKAEKKKLQLEWDLKQRQIEHAERLKALEMGQPLPDGDIAAARAETNRAWAAAAVGFTVPPAMFGLSLGATAIILAMSVPDTSLPVLCVLWAAAGATSIVAVVMSAAGVLRRGRRPEVRGTPARGNRPARNGPTTAVTEQVPDLNL
jgi:hypothetical protein